MGDVLLLNSEYSPVRVLSWQRAMCLLLTDKVNLVAEYPGRVIRSAQRTFPWPAVVMLAGFTRHVPQRIRFSRANVLARDGYTCQYCGMVPRNRDGRALVAALTLDHVVPRAQARGGFVLLPWNSRRVGLTGWENVVASCKECNRRKGDRTPDQAGMRLLAVPYRPAAWDAIRIAFGRALAPRQWDAFLPAELKVRWASPRAVGAGAVPRRQ